MIVDVDLTFYIYIGFYLDSWFVRRGKILHYVLSWNITFHIYANVELEPVIVIVIVIVMK